MYGMYSEDCEGCGCLVGMGFGGPLVVGDLRDAIENGANRILHIKNLSRSKSIARPLHLDVYEEQSNSCCFVWPLWR